MKELPIYDITIEDDAEIQGVSKISLVDVPAIGVNWIALRKAELNLQDVFGYETQHFDICPGAQKTFENYSKMQLDEDTIGMIRSAAQNADNVFEIEKRVVAEGRATSQDLEQVKTLVADFKDIIAEIDKITNQPQNVDYMDGHIKVVEDLLPKTMMAVRKKKSKMSFAKKECLGCPPNGDGTRVNGEPDKRCKGDGAGKTPKAGGGKATAKPSTSPKNTATPEQSISKISQIGSTMGQVIDDKKILDNAKKSGFLVYEDVSAANKTINLSPPSGEYRVKIVYNPDGNIGAAKGKPYLAIEDTYRGGEQAQREHWNSKPVQDGLKELFKMKKQNFAKRECLGCPPNGDGTRVNGEPDKRCKGDGADKAGGVKTPKVSTKVSESASNDLQNPKTSEDFTGPKAVEQANNSYVDAIINETTNALTQEYFPDWMKNKQSPPDGPDRRRDYHTAAMRYLGIENDKTWDYDKGKPTKSEPGQKRKVTDLGGYKEIQWSFSKKQTFAKRECLGCPPNGDGTRVNGEPDRRCKGDGTGKTPKAGGGKAQATKSGAKNATKAAEVDAKVKDIFEKADWRTTPKMTTTDEIDSALKYMENDDPKYRFKVAASNEVLADFVAKESAKLSGEYVKTGLTLDRNVRGEGPADYLEQKYGKDWDKLEVYKKDFIQTRNGESWLIKDVPFVKVKGEWIRTDARQVQGAQFDGSHPAFNKYQWSTTPGGFDSRTGARKDGTIFSYGASDRRDNR